MTTFQNSTALVTGASGFLGGALAQRLAAAGLRVRALVRSPQKAAFLRDQPTIEVVQGDITDAARMLQVAQGCQYVFHVAAALEGDSAYQRLHTVEGTRHVLRAAEAAAVQRFVHVSTIAVYGYDLPPVVTEALPPQPRFDPYNVAKSEAEALVRAAHVPYSIIRPGGIFGARSSLWTATMFTIARRNPTIFVGDGSGSAPVIYVDDVVALMLLLATHPNAVGQAFHCVLDPAPTWREFLGAYARLAGHQRWLGLPTPLVSGLAQLAALGAAPTTRRRTIPAIARYLTWRTRYSMDSARDQLGWTPTVNLETGVARCAPWLRAKNLLR